MFKLPNYLFSPEGPPAGGGAPPSGDKESMVDFLKDDAPVEKEDEIDLEDKDDDKEEKIDKDDEDDDKKDEDKDDTKDDELEALVEDAEEPSDEQLEVVTPVRRKEILAKYPTLFKDFPYLEKAYYREQQFTELFPTIKEAQAAGQKSQNFDQIESELMNGNSTTILESVKEMDVNSFHQLIDNFLPTLQKVDKEAYVHLLSNVSRHIIADLVNATKKSKNEIYENAASVLNQWLFNTTEFEDPTPLAKKTDTGESDKEVKLREREKDFARRRFETTHSELNGRVTNSVRAAIESNIDPKGSMTEYVKRTAVREANEALENAVKSDARFKGIVDRLWEAAIKADFSKESVDRIRSAYLSKAKTLLPSVIKRARIEALRGMGKRVREETPDNEKEPKTPQKGQKKEGAPRSHDGGRIKEAKDIPKGMSTFDFLSLPD